ncbi:hypothetical protein Tco_0734764 [Tanacetum coccineum]
MTGNISILCNFVEKYLGTVCFGNDQFALILGYGDLVQGNITINKVYYVKGLNHNLFSVGQFCDADLEVAFRKSTCFVRDLQGNDLLTSNRGSDLYTISLQEKRTSSTPICLLAKSLTTQAWLPIVRKIHLKENGSEDGKMKQIYSQIIIERKEMKWEEVCAGEENKTLSPYKSELHPSMEVWRGYL